MINLGAFYSDSLDLNGDQGNLLALKRYLEAAGFEVSMQDLDASSPLGEIHFLLLGHGSMAAMASVSVTLGTVDFAAIMSNTPGLAVGSGFEFLSGGNLTKGKVALGDRDSEFAVGELGAISALGYRNTDSGLPNLELNGNWMCSMLHGPLLAKNPVLLDRAAKAAVAKAGLSWPSDKPAGLVAWVDMLNRVCAQIWQVECQIPYPELTL